MSSTKKRSIVVKENNRQFVVLVPANCDAEKIQIDTKDFETGKQRCDYAICITPTCKQLFFFVELKGSDILKAARQLVATAESQKTLYKGYVQKEAWVISGGWRPAISTQYQVQERKLKKLDFVLKHATKTYTFDFQRRLCS